MKSPSGNVGQDDLFASKYISYLRISTRRQEVGSSLEVQRAAVSRYIKSVGGHLVDEFQEIESGRKNDRPELARCLDLCRLTGSTLCVSRLDRLSRDKLFISQLQQEVADGSLTFVVAEMPEASSLTIGFMALLAQHESELIGTRIRASQAVRREQERLGLRPKRTWTPREASLMALTVHSPIGRQRGAISTAKRADKFAKRLEPIIRNLMAHGTRTLQGIADQLNRREILTATKRGHWGPRQVAYVLDRLGIERRRYRFARRGTLKKHQRQVGKRTVPSIVLRERQDQRRKPPRVRNRPHPWTKPSGVSEV